MEELPLKIREQAREAERMLNDLGGAVVAFSGGVDSALLLALAANVLGDRCLAMTAVSPSLPRRELEEARALARRLGVRHRLIDTQELEREGFAENTGLRCFHCKSELFDHCFTLAEEEGLPAVVYGATADDRGDHRPGMRAARERGARAPLMEAGFDKQAIRELSRALGLPTWNKPAKACLSSRFPYGTRVTEEGLSKVERAEEVLYRMGFRVYRVRFHGPVARIEVSGEEWPRFHDPAVRTRVNELLREAGFPFVSLDLAPFVSGNMNRTLESDSGG